MDPLSTSVLAVSLSIFLTLATERSCYRKMGHDERNNILAFQGNAKNSFSWDHMGHISPWFLLLFTEMGFGEYL